MPAVRQQKTKLDTQFYSSHRRSVFLLSLIYIRNKAYYIKVLIVFFRDNTFLNIKDVSFVFVNKVHEKHNYTTK